MNVDFRRMSFENKYTLAQNIISLINERVKRKQSFYSFTEGEFNNNIFILKRTYYKVLTDEIVFDGGDAIEKALRYLNVLNALSDDVSSE